MKIKFIPSILSALFLCFSLSLTFATNLQQGTSGFVKNMGQIADNKGNIQNEILFKAEIPGGHMYFKSNSIEYQFFKFQKKEEEELSEQEKKDFKMGNYAAILDKMYVYRTDLEFEGCNNSVNVIGKNEGTVKRHFYLAHCPDGIMNVKEYKEIIYQNIYNKIDLRFYFIDGGLKYDFIIHPGGNPDDIRLKYKGINDLYIMPNGDMNVYTEMGIITEKAPYTFYEDEKKIIPSTYFIDNGLIRFNLGTHDNRKTVVIDPVVHWATYYSNGQGGDTWTRPVFDSFGNMFNAAYTYSANYVIVNPGAGVWIDATRDGATDLVIVKFDANHQLVWATYYGGNDTDILTGHTDYGKAIAIDDNDNLYVGGFAYPATTSFPTLNMGGGAYYHDQTKIYGNTDFILKFNNAGMRLWATMFQHDNANTNSAGMRLNGIVAKGTYLYFTGETYRWNNNDVPLRTLTGAYNNSTFVGSQDAFLGRFNGAGVLEWCTYLNSGNASLNAWSQGVDLTVDNNGNLFFVGRESNVSNNQKHLLINPGSGAYYQAINAGDQDLTLTKFNSSMQAVWSTYYGGDIQDIPSMIDVDNAGNLLVVCRSVTSTNWPCYNPGGGAYFQNTKAALGSSNDSGILKFSNNGVRLWATYYGGGGTYTSGVNTYNASTTLSGIGTDMNGDIYVSGHTSSPTFPTQNQAGSYFSGTRNGQSDAVFMKFNSSGVRQWATYYGGSATESLYSGKGALYNGVCETAMVAFGVTSSADFPTVNPGGGALYQSTSATTNNNVIFYFNEGGGSISLPPVSAIALPSSFCPGDTVWLYINGGTLGSGATWEWYQGSCGSNHVGTGDTIFVIPTATTTYYVRAEGSCNTTTCVSVTVTLNTLSVAPTGLNANPSVICAGNPVVLTVVGGSLGLGAVWELFEGSCGGTPIASNATGIFTVNPTLTTTYYVRAAGTCNNTPCASVTVTVNSNSTAPASLIANPPVLCFGDTVNLTVNGGSLGTGGVWNLYADNCGGTLIASNTSGSFTVTPTTTTTYYVEAAGLCNTTNCVAQTITLSPIPDVAGTISGPISLCQGDVNVSYTISPVNHATTYVWSLPPGFTGSSTSNTIIVNISAGATSGTISVYGANPCGNGVASSLMVTVNPLPIVDFSNTIGPFCLNETFVVLSGGVPAGGTYTGTTVVNNTFNPSLAGSGNHVITYTYTDGNGCTNSAVNSITVWPVPQVSIDSLLYLCEGLGNYLLTSGQPSGGTYFGSYVQHPNFDAASAGVDTHTVNYYYTDINGCSDTASALITIVPQVELVSDLPDNTIYAGVGTDVNFTALPAQMGVYDFYVDANMLQSSTDNQFAAQISAHSTLVFVTLNNVCSDTLLISIKPIPNAFTPINVDGHNDIFMPHVDLLIVNRWGQLLYRGKEGWDGTYKGKKVSPGTYYYIIYTEDVNTVFTGSVLVVDEK